MIMVGGEKMVDFITSYLNEIKTDGKIPTKFKESEIVLVHKKGDPENYENYRPISLLNHVYKIFMKMITTNMKQYILSQIPTNHAAY